MDQEELELKHRKEKKDLQAKIQAIKKSVPKGDKKRKKEAAEEIARLEAELEQTQQAELQACQAHPDGGDAEDLPQNNIGEEAMSRLNLAEDTEDHPQKLSKAQKRRNKKAQEEKEKAERITAAEKDNVNSSRNIENKQFAALTSRRNLKIKQIASDGHCMYNAVVHQLALQGVQETLESVRRKVSAHMKSHAEDFMCFLIKPDTGDVLTPEEYEKYCNDMAETAVWGGHHEMKAITEIYRRPIEVLQAQGPALNIGEQFKEQPLMLSYHRHEYGLGEHYNSVVEREKEQAKDET